MLLVKIKNKSCSLFSKQAIKSFKEKCYKFNHIGLIQVAIKPLTRKGINTTVLLILKNIRFKVFEPSLLRMVIKSNPC
jgi:two-component SAPR family response regulator